MHAASVAESQMTGLWDYVDRGAMSHSIEIFHSLNIAPAVFKYVLDPASYMFPQDDAHSSGERLVVPEGKIAVVALSKHERVSLGPRVVLHPLQKDALAYNGFLQSDITYVEEVFGGSEYVIASNGKRHGTASVCGSHITWPPGHINAKPAIIFNIDDGGQPPELDPSMTFHELVHIAHRLSNAYAGLERTRQTDELEAYAVQAASVMNDHRVPFTLSAQLAGKIDKLRKLYIGEKSYTVTPEFMNAISSDEQLKKMFS